MICEGGNMSISIVRKLRTREKNIKQYISQRSLIMNNLFINTQLLYYCTCFYASIVLNHTFLYLTWQLNDHIFFQRNM